MNTCYYYQDLLPRPVQVLLTVPFNPTWSILPTRLPMIARGLPLFARLIWVLVWYSLTGLASFIFRTTSFGW